MTAWLVGRAHATDLMAAQHEEIAGWLRGLGIEPRDVPSVAVVQDGDRYVLHLSEFVRDAEGRIVLDVAADEVARRPVVHGEVPDGSWPGWLTGMGRAPRVDAPARP